VEAYKTLNQNRDEYRVSIETFAEQVREYIDLQGKNFRLNSFADEVGRFTGQDSKLMLNLQTVAESLATKCDGRLWIFVTSQGDLKTATGELKKEKGDDFTKAQGRFKTRPNLTSADVKEVSVDLFSKVPIYLNGSRLETVKYGEPRNRFHKAQPTLRLARPFAGTVRRRQTGAPAPQATGYIPASSLRAKCGPFIASEPDLDPWLSSLRKSALEELAKCNRISLWSTG
jgi:hypothetical protein